MFKVLNFRFLLFHGVILSAPTRQYAHTGQEAA